MNLEQELRAALGQQAEMTNATRPDVDGVISGGQVRRRRRNIAWIGGAAAAVVLVGGAIYGITQLDGGDDRDTKTASEPTETSGSESPSVPWYPDDDDTLAPGTYRFTPVIAASGDTIAAVVTFLGEGWAARSNPVVSDDNGVASIGVYEPVALGAGTGCSDDPAVTGILGQSPEGLAGQLTGLPSSEVIQPPTPTGAFGRDAVHLRLRVDPTCGAVAVYRPVETTTGQRGMTYTRVERELIVDFWVVEVEGVLLMVDMVHNPDTPPALVQQAADAAASIIFVSEE